MRKLPILLFTAVFALSLALPAYAAESSNEELKAASQYLNSHGIMVGDGEGNMNFSAPLTRAHLATILARLHGGSGQVEESRDFYAAQCQFQDVPDWARQYAGYCAYHGLMVGYGDGLFYEDGSLGRLKIPSLGLSVKVYEDESLESLAKGAGHFKSTSCWDGNVGLAGHNRGVANHFGQIHTLEDGDKITYTTKLGTRTYEVFYVGQIEETDFSRLGRSSENMITLITCVRNVPEMRWCVQAREIT